MAASGADGNAVSNGVRKDLLKVLGLALVSLFLVPASTWLFAQHAQQQLDRTIIQSVERQIDQDPSMSAESKAHTKGFYRDNPTSRICADSDLVQDPDMFCEPFSDAWQFYAAHLIAKWTIAGGVAILMVELLLGVVAFWSRKAQYPSFVTGWRLLSLASAAQMLVQGTMLVWLSFWVTAVFFHVYYIKLILLIGFIVAVAIFFAVAGLLKRPALGNTIDGELVRDSDAPGVV